MLFWASNHLLRFTQNPIKMVQRKKETPSMVVVFCAVFLTVTFQVSFSASEQLQNSIKTKTHLPHRVGSSFIFPVQGDIYRTGAFYTTVYIGNPPKPYFLDIDTGSNLTWVQCAAAPDAKLLKAPHNPYKPNNNVVFCEDPLCAFVDQPKDHPCEAPNDQCDYWVQYADYGSSFGALVRDSFALDFRDGFTYTLAFGCGYDQEFAGPFPPYVDGVLGLATGKSSIVSQLKSLGVTRNVIGHCLGGQGKGYLFFGDDLFPKELVWARMLPNPLNHYLLGPVELLFGSKTSGLKDLRVVFDSGSTYTYLNPQAYQATLTVVMEMASLGKLSAVEDGTLPVCWKGGEPFKSIDAVKKNFSPLTLSIFTLSFKNTKSVGFVIPPEAYLIITSRGNVCLGILNGADARLGNLNIIGDISLQDKMVIYDNENQQIGWVAANCDTLPNADRDYVGGGSSQPPGSSSTGI